MIYRFEGEENNPKTLRYRAIKSDGTDLKQADVSSIKLFVYETESETLKTAAGGETLTVGSVVFDTLQSWDIDEDGYNVRVTVSGTYLTDAGKTYRVEVKITPTSGEAYYLDHVEIKCVETYSA
jgi:hypothetical protein